MPGLQCTLTQKPSTLTPKFLPLWKSQRSPYCKANFKQNLNIGTFWAQTSLIPFINYFISW